MISAVTLALSKGRILDECLPLLAQAGIAPAGDLDRQLRVATSDAQVSLLIVRPTDVPVYVAHGAADIGIVGKDTLLEYGGEAFYEPLDLGISPCRMAVCAVAGFRWPRDGRRLKVATKYPQIARRHFATRSEQVEIIKLYGSMELAPLVGLADVIVDLVNTGNTLRANGLVELEKICDVTSRVAVNKASMKLKHAAVGRILSAFEEARRG